MARAAAVERETDEGGYSLDLLESVLRSDLAPQVEAIDEQGRYPEAVMRRLGAIGVFRQHLPDRDTADLWPAIEATSLIGTVCGASAFMAWCQNTLVWYVANSPNTVLRERHLENVASAMTLGGTGLSNPMKSFFGIETLKLTASTLPENQGLAVRGVLPWVSNLGADHLFGTIAAGPSGAPVMVLVDCAAPSLQMKPCAPFLGMDGTGTYALQFRDVAIPPEMVLADPAAPFVSTIRNGFILLQTGMGLGLIRDCIALMDEVRPTLGHINGFLEVQPTSVADELAVLEAEIRALAATPFDRDPAFWRRVVAARLATSELSLKAAQAAMLHCGARGYTKAHRAQRRLREAYFVAIVTPATKQLRKMLSLVDAAA